MVLTVPVFLLQCRIPVYCLICVEHMLILGYYVLCNVYVLCLIVIDLPDCPMYALLQVLHSSLYIPLGFVLIGF